MLVLSRKTGERIVIGRGAVVVTVLGASRDKTKIGIEAPGLLVLREEVAEDRIQNFEEENGNE